MSLAETVKNAARSDLRALAEEAGFRLARGKTYHCALHPDRTPSVHLYDNAVYCFSCGKRFDAIDLADELIVKGSTGDAIRWLAARYGIEAGTPEKRERFSDATRTEAELFGIGFCWYLERYLTLLKELWAIDETARECSRIKDTTSVLNFVCKATANDMSKFYVEFKRHSPKLVKQCIAETTELQMLVAGIVCQMPSRAAA